LFLELHLSATKGHFQCQLDESPKAQNIENNQKFMKISLKNSQYLFNMELLKWSKWNRSFIPQMLLAYHQGPFSMPVK